MKRHVQDWIQLKTFPGNSRDELSCLIIADIFCYLYGHFKRILEPVKNY
jgi:hypothetical protein